MAATPGGKGPPDDRPHKQPWQSKMPSSREQRPIKYVYQLPYVTLRELCRVIDCNDKWEELGGSFLGFDIPTLYEFRRPLHGTSSSEAMLSRWGQKDGSLDRLFVYLASMEFAWAMRILRPFVSDRVKHLLEERGCTTILDEFARGVKPDRYRNANEGSDTSCFRLNSSKNMGRYGDTDVYSTAGGYKASMYPGGNSHLSRYDEKSRSRRREPQELSSPSSGATVSITSLPSFPTHSVNNNLDKFKKEDAAASPKVDVSPHSPEDDGSEKIMNFKVEKGASVGKTPGERRSPTERPHDRRPADFQLDHFPQQNPNNHRKMSNDSPRANEEEGSSPNRRPSDTPSLTYTSLPQVSYKEILQATHDFRTKVLGRGGFGTVYNGKWKNTPVAIKLIKKKDNPGVAALDEAKFKQSLCELRVADWCRHDNILPLYSYSINDEGLCLIYQLMVNGSLEDRLRCSNNTPPLTWLQRCRIARGAACGIQFLHAFDRPLIHGDIKSANILLDKSLEPKLGDFGLVREGPPDAQTHVYVDYVNGTRAYLPPEYMRNKKLSTKVDTYSFGIVLFEVATGQRALDDKRSRDKRSLYECIHDATCEELMQLKDANAGIECADEFNTLITIGRDCTILAHKQRPLMVDVFHRLEQHLHFQEIRNKARKDSNAESIRQKDLSPKELQMLHDLRPKETVGQLAKEAATNNNGKCAKAKEDASNQPHKNENFGAVGRHATEQTVPTMSRFNHTYEAQAAHPHLVGSPMFHAKNVPPTFNDYPHCNYMCEVQAELPSYYPESQAANFASARRKNSLPPSYEEAMKVLPTKDDGISEKPLQKNLDCPQETSEQSEYAYIPKLSVLGMGKRKEVPIGEAQVVSYSVPPGDVSLNASSSAENGAVGGDAVGDHFEQQFFVGGRSCLNQESEISALFEDLSAN